VSEFNPYHNWKWVAGFLWLTCHYNHLFEELNSTRTKLTFVVEGEGFGAPILGGVYAGIYSKFMDRANSLLVEEMNASQQRNS
jgi:hypothetical protein